jgi:hypothetical protein
LKRDGPGLESPGVSHVILESGWQRRPLGAF